MKNILLMAVAVLGLSACQMKQKVMDANIVSMTHTNVPEGMKLTEAGPVTGQFCSDMHNDRGTIGLFDEAVKSAQQTNKIDFITNVTFWRDGNGCVLLEGTGQRLMAVGTATTETVKPAAAVAPTTKTKKTK